MTTIRRRPADGRVQTLITRSTCWEMSPRRWDGPAAEQVVEQYTAFCSATVEAALSRAPA